MSGPETEAAAGHATPREALPLPEALERLAVEMDALHRLARSIEDATEDLMSASRASAADVVQLQRLDYLTQALGEIQHAMRRLAAAAPAHGTIGPDTFQGIKLETIRNRLLGASPGGDADPAVGAVKFF